MLGRQDPVRRVVDALRANSSTEFAVPGARVDLLGRSGGRFSIVQRVRIRTPERTTYAYIKILKPRGPDEWRQAEADQLIAREHRATRAVYDAVREEPQIRAVRALAWLPEHRAIVTDEIAGRSLRQLLESRASEEELSSLIRRVGTWVRLYQRAGGTRGIMDLADHRQYLEKRLTFIDGRVVSAAECRAIRARFERLVREVVPEDSPRTWIHADLTPENVIIGDDGRLTVLDFTAAKVGPAYHDVSHFYFHLQLMAGRAPSRRAELGRLGLALLEGYNPALTVSNPAFRLLLLQHSICHIAWLAERRVPMLDAAYRWFVRRRWQTCERILVETCDRQVA